MKNYQYEFHMANGKTIRRKTGESTTCANVYQWSDPNNVQPGNLMQMDGGWVEVEAISVAKLLPESEGDDE